MVRLRKFGDDLFSQMWFRPTVWIVSLGILAVVLTSIDIAYDPLRRYFDLPWFLRGDVENVRVMLGSVSSATLTVATLTFSIVMLAVIQTSNAYSPHILRVYTSDPINQHVLGLLIGTFVYALVVLRGVLETEDARYVPLLAMNVALVLALVSTGAFVYFVHHAADSLKVDSIISHLVQRTGRILEDQFPSTEGEPWPEDGGPEPDLEAAGVVLAPEDGNIQLFQGRHLFKQEYEQVVTIQLCAEIGDYVIEGTPLYRVWPAELAHDLREPLLKSVTIGTERNLVQDIRFGIRLIADVALRALSPSLNDPSTAIMCVDGLSSLLADYLRHGPVVRYRTNEAHTLCLILPRPDFDELLYEAFSQIWRQGEEEISVLLHMLEACGSLGYVSSRAEDRHTLWLAVNEIMQTADRGFEAVSDRKRLDRVLRDIAPRLHYDPTPLLLEADTVRPPAYG